MRLILSSFLLFAGVAEASDLVYNCQAKTGETAAFKLDKINDSPFEHIAELRFENLSGHKVWVFKRRLVDLIPNYRAGDNTLVKRIFMADGNKSTITLWPTRDKNEYEAEVEVLDFDFDRMTCIKGNQ